MLPAVVWHLSCHHAPSCPHPRPVPPRAGQQPSELWVPRAVLGSCTVTCSSYWFIELLQGTAGAGRAQRGTGTCSYCGGVWQDGMGQDEGSLCLLCPLHATMEPLCSFRWDFSGTTPSPGQHPL